MTDTMGGGRGGVGIRLYTSGGEVVKRTFGQVGDSGKKMWAEIAMGEKAANPALRAMSRASGEAQGAVQGLGTRAGGVANVLGAFGAAGVVMAAGLGAAVLALNQTREALNFADEIAAAAARIGIGAEALQEWRFAAVEAGLAATDADSAIESFQKKLGEGLAGGRSIKWFERLGFSRDDLKAFDTTEEALDAVIARISDLGSEAERAAVADKLGLGSMITLVRLGADAIEEMRQRARDLGVVMDESMIKRAGEANRELEILSQVVDMQLKQSFIDLAPVLIETMKFVGWLAEGLRDAAEAWKELDQRSTAGLRDEYDRHAQIINRYMNRPGVQGPDDLDFLARRQFDASNARMGEITATLARRAAARSSGGVPGGGVSLQDVNPPPRGGGGGGGAGDATRQAEQRAREADRALEQLRQAELKAERDALQARFGPGGTEENSTELALALVTIEKEASNAARAALRAALEKAGALDAIVEARLEELRVAQGEAAKARDAAILTEEAREIAARRLEQETAREEDAIALMDLDLELVRSAQERAAIARRILLAQQALEAKRLEAELGEDGGLSADDQDRINRLRVRQGREVQLFDQNQRDDLRAQFQSYGQEVVSAIEAGRIGEHIGDQLKARLIEMALNGLFDFLNPAAGGAQGGGGSIWSMGARIVGSLFGAGPGRAGGGSLMSGMRHPVVETGRPELLMIGGQGQVTGAAETARLLRDLAEGGSAGGAGANGGRGGFEGGLDITLRTTRDFDARIRSVSREEARQAATLSGAQTYRASVAAAPGAIDDRRAYKE